MRKGLMLLSVFILCVYLCMSIYPVSYMPYKESNMIQVEVHGALTNPGSFTLERGSTMQDLLPELALSEKADISSFALLNPLHHRDYIVIPEKEEIKLISINASSLEELCLLPGIGPATATKIIEYRTQYGGFKTLSEIMDVQGIGKVKYESILPFITL